MTDQDRRTRPRWCRLLTGGACLAVVAWIWATRGEVVLAQHPAYAVVTAAWAALGLLLVGLGLRRRPSDRGRSVARMAGCAALVLTVALALAVTVWLRPFSASPAARALTDDEGGLVVTSSARTITLRPDGVEEPTTALVFQPGARVDARASLPLLTSVAGEGYLVVVVKQPLNIGFLAGGAPTHVIAAHPEVEHWVVGGHSLGGVVASSFAADEPGLVDGLLLWASYPLDDGLASRDDLAVTSISGSEDGLTTPADIADSRADLPADTTFVEVPGAVHSFFGDYGSQPGDGQPTTTRSEAQEAILAASLELMRSVDNG